MRGVWLDETLNQLTNIFWHGLSENTRPVNELYNVDKVILNVLKEY